MQYIAMFIYYFVCLSLHLNNLIMKETISLRLDAVLMDFLRKEAGKDFRSVNNFVEMILLKHMQEQQAKQKPGE